MERPHYPWKHVVWILAASLLINCIFLYLYDPHNFIYMTQLHGNVAYNFYFHNSLRMNHRLAVHIDSLILESENQLIEYDRFRNEPWGEPDSTFPINDTVTYGILLGLLWKLTHSLRFIDIQLLQIAIFCLIQLFVYRIASLLVLKRGVALLIVFLQLLFFPLVALNVQPARDIWGYYGTVLLLHCALSYVFSPMRTRYVLLYGVLFGVCQLIRPAIFPVVITLSGLFLIYAATHRCYRERIRVMISVLLITNAYVFWIPFTVFNKIAYDRFFVGPLGHDLVIGLGEFPNQWGFQLSDDWISAYLFTKYGVHHGTPAFDECARKEFLKAFHENPGYFFGTLARRIPQALLPGLPWVFREQSPYPDSLRMWQKLTYSFSSGSMLADFLLRQVYIRFYLFVAYCGIAYALRKREYFMTSILIFGVVVGGMGKFISHVEYRYLIPFYWVSAFFMGYLFWGLYNKRERFISSSDTQNL